MTTSEPRKLDRWDLAVCVVLALAYLSLLLSTVHDLGYARDEGFYFQAARSYEAWFELLGSDFSKAIEPLEVDRYWYVNREHPVLMKTLFALSHRYLFTALQLFREPGTAYRFPGMVVSTLGVLVTYVWGARESGRLAGVVGALSLSLMPRVFYHSHLACFDMPVTSLLLLTSYAYARSLEGGWRWPVATGVIYGLLLNTKHNAWLLPGAFGLHFLLTRGKGVLAELREKRWPVPHAFLAMLLISPLVFYAGWPWIWHDTLPRLREYVNFHLQHDYYNMEFLGQTYWKPPMPRLYAWLMTLATVPSITLLLFAIGLGKSLWRRPLPSTPLLWGLCLLMCYAPWWSSATPIFGGTKHWMTAYPFLCLFAGTGFAFAASRIARLSPGKSWALAAPPALSLCVLLGPLCMTLHSTPWGLSFYTPLVGGAPGAASLGLNRSFWGYTTGTLQDEINQRAPQRGYVFVHDMALASWEMLRLDHRLREDLRGRLSIPISTLALFHHEPHMRRVEYQTWVEYGHDAPAAIRTFDGVPIVWLYAR
ncbi:MAG TPA: glycosyltransferase family 39 protein [Polyangiaceae bacterium]|nr:glycosyltransferase family 39 protein [Polyangiaceae bacterium]